LAEDVDEPVAAIVEAFIQGGAEERSRVGAKLVRRFEPVVRKAWRDLLYRHSRIEYDDFMQDVFLRLFTNLRQLRCPAAFPGYFRQIARSVAFDALRKAHGQVSLAEINEEELSTRLDQTILAAVLVRSYLEQLPRGEREVLDLEYVAGLSPVEIMRKTGLSRGGISAAKTRGINRLREICRKEAEQLKGGAKEIGRLETS
jgi:RNA polymerase sigma factor (sigma-70 family)